MLFTIPGLGGATAVSAPHALLHPALAAPVHPALSHSHPAIHATPAAALSGNYYKNTSGFAVTANPASHLLYGFYNYTYPQAQNPSLMTLGNGHIGISYSILTTQTSNNCSSGPGYVNASGNTTIRVGFSLSTDNGTTFGAPVLMGNNTCPYIQALEPSFGVSSTHEVFGTFVEANATEAAINGLYGYGQPVMGYTARTSDALGFVTSSDNGTTFSNATTITIAGSSNIARPSLATFGRTIYIAYDNISTGAGTVAGGANSISVRFVYSSDAGATWNGPYTLPGLNASQYNTSMTPSVAVAPNGTVAVAYDTNRSCVAYCPSLSFYNVYADSIVLATSSTNGTTWVGPHLISNVGGAEGYNFAGGYNYAGAGGLFEASPNIAATFDSVSNSWYVVWTGGVNRSSSVYFYYQWWGDQAFSAASADNGATWAVGTIGAGLVATMYSYGGYYNPGVGVSPTGEEYVTLSFYNSSGGGCGLTQGGYLSYGSAEYTSQSADGVHWAGLTASAYAKYAAAYEGYVAYTGAVAFTSSGTELTGYAMVQNGIYKGYINGHYTYEYPVLLEVAQPFVGTNVTLTVYVGNAPVGSTWGVNVDGNIYTTTGASLNISVPSGYPLILAPTSGPVPDGYWAELIPSFNGPTGTILFSNTTYWENYSQYYGLQVSLEALNAYDIGVQVFNYGAVGGYQYNWYWNSYLGHLYQGGCPFPWFLPAGLVVHLGMSYTYPVGAYYYLYNSVPIFYWNGTGTGSFTGSGSSANFTMSGPTNETMWQQVNAVFDITVDAPALPSSSTYTFTWDGAAHTAAGGTPVVLPKVSTGPHWITAIQATSTLSGWAYFGSSTVGNPVAIPENPQVNLSFAYVHVSAPAGVVSFHASGIVAGSVWQLKFNGTVLSSSSPWINVTAHPGTYSVAAYPVTAGDGSTGYTPTTFGPSLNVTTGSTYQVTYTSAFRLSVLAGVGGKITPAGSTSLVVPGTIKSYNATPNTGFRFLGWSGSGTGAYTGSSTWANFTVGGPVEETASFAPLVSNRFNLTFTQSAIPTGTWWTVFINGVGYSSSNGTLTIPNVNSCLFSGGLGRYTLQVPYAYVNGSNLTRYVPLGAPNTVCGGTVQPLNFMPSYYLSLQSTAGGSLVATVGAAGTQSTTSTWVSPTDTISLQASNANGYLFLGWNGTGPGSYSGANNPTVISVGGPASELAVFAPVIHPPPPRYFANFHLTAPLSAGTVWSVTLGTATYSSTGVDLLVPNLLSAVYPVKVLGTKSPDGATQYTPSGAPTQENVNANLTNIPVTFRTAYWVSVSALGPGTASPGSGWVAAGTTINLAATPTGLNVFKGWAGTGAGAYSGSFENQSVQVNNPIVEVASFSGPAPATTVLSSSWNSSSLWAALAIAGLVVGLIVGVVVMRMRGGGSPPKSAAPPTPATTGEPEPASEPLDLPPEESQ